MIIIIQAIPLAGMAWLSVYIVCVLFLLIVEEHVAKVLERLLLVRLTDEERDIVVAAAIRNHTYRYVLHSVKDKSLKAEVVPVEVTHHADDAHVAVHGYRAIFLELVHNLVKVRCIVNTHRYAHLTRGNHVDRSLITLEYLEHLTQETCGEEHS